MIDKVQEILAKCTNLDWQRNENILVAFLYGYKYAVAVSGNKIVLQISEHGGMLYNVHLKSPEELIEHLSSYTMNMAITLLQAVNLSNLYLF